MKKFLLVSLLICSFSLGAGAQLLYQNSGVFSAESGYSTENTKVRHHPGGGYVIAGEFGKTIDFDLSESGEYNLTAPIDTWDVFVAKYTDEDELEWAFQLGNDGWEYFSGIAFDPAGNIIIMGIYDYSETNDIDLDPSEDEFLISFTEYPPYFMAKYSSSGEFIWGQNVLPWVSSNTTLPIVTDATGDIYIAGSINYFSIDIDPSEDSEVIVDPVNGSLIIAKYSGETGEFIWVEQCGSEGTEAAEMIISPDENLYITGFYYVDTDFDPSEEEYIIPVTQEGYNHSFICKYSTDGELIWGKGYGAEEVHTFITDIDIDENAVYGLGYTEGGSMTVTSIDLEGNDNWTINISDDNNVSNSSPLSSAEIEITNNGTVLVSGLYYNGFQVDFDPSEDGTAELTALSERNGFIAEYTTNGAFVQVIPSVQTYSEDDFYMDVESMSISETGMVIQTGIFDTSALVYNETGETTINGVGQDGFLVKFLLCTPTEIDLTESFCTGSSFEYNGMVFSETGDYTMEGTDDMGCSVITTLSLTENVVDTTVVTLPGSFVAAEENASYQWYTCDVEAIDGATDQTFYPEENGSYLVEITTDNCVFTTQCYDITTLSTSSILAEKVKLYPVPVKENMSLTVEIPIPAQATIYDATGRVFFQEQLQQGANALEIPEIAAGLYFIKLEQIGIFKFQVAK